MPALAATCSCLTPLASRLSLITFPIVMTYILCSFVAFFGAPAACCYFLCILSSFWFSVNLILRPVTHTVNRIPPQPWREPEVLEKRKGG